MRLSRLRSLAALAHVVPGARILLTSAAGVEVVVDRTAHADLDPCAFRRVVLHSGVPGASRLHEAVAVAAVGGSVEDLGGGRYRSPAKGEASLHWLVAGLAPTLVRDALSSCPLERDGAEIEASLRGDPELGVTVVRLSVVASDPRLADAVSSWAQTACLVGEVERFLGQVDVGVDGH